MRRLAGGVTLLIAVSGCANRLVASSAPTEISSALDVSSGSFARMSEAMNKCEALAQRPIPFAEEQRIGAMSTMVRLDEARKRPGAADGGAVFDGAWLGLSEADLAELDRDLNLLGKGLAGFSGRPHLPWVFGVVDLERPFLVAGGGGAIFISAGLLSRVESEAQLALVLALGIAHVAQRDDVAAYQQALKAACLARALDPEVRDLPRAIAPLFSFEGLPQPDVEKLAQHVARTLSARGAIEAGHVALAVPLVAYAGYQPAEGARLLESLQPGDGLWRVDGHGAAEQVRALAAGYEGTFHLTVPASRAAELVRKRAAAR